MFHDFWWSNFVIFGDLEWNPSKWNQPFLKIKNTSLYILIIIYVRLDYFSVSNNSQVGVQISFCNIVLTKQCGNLVAQAPRTIDRILTFKLWMGQNTSIHKKSSFSNISRKIHQWRFPLHKNSHKRSRNVTKNHQRSWNLWNHFWQNVTKNHENEITKDHQKCFI